MQTHKKIQVWTALKQNSYNIFIYKNKNANKVKANLTTNRENDCLNELKQHVCWKKYWPSCTFNDS